MKRFFATLVLLPAAALAQTNINWTTTSPDGDSGNWSDTTKWTGGNIPDTSTENAIFGGYPNARTVTLNGDFTIGSLTIQPRNSSFAGQGFTLQLPTTPVGNEILRLTTGLTIGNGNTANLNIPIEVTANQTWTGVDNPGGSAIFNGVISGAGRITRTASGPSSTFTFNGANTFSGGFEQLAANAPTTVLGTSSVVSAGAIVSGPLGTGTVTLQGGGLRSTGSTARTLANNVAVSGAVTFGGSGNTGALTFSDAGLTAPTTFTLNNATDGANTILRSFNTGVTIDQVIAEAGGVGQNLHFASTSGTPTVTIGRTKTSTGSLLAGGVNLVLNNGAPNPGSLVTMGGSVTATGANRLSSGLNIFDGTNLALTDAANLPAGPGRQSSVYNNARVNFATAPDQATVAGAFSADSDVRLAIGSGSGNATISQNYNQAAIGSGRAGLVSGSTGTTTYTGTLLAGSDNVFRVGGGVGTLALGSALTGANALRVEGGGTLTTSVNHTYTGSTTLTSGVTTLTGAAGALSGTSGITINSGATLNIESGATGNNRLNDSASLTLNAGSIVFNSNTSNVTFSETAGNLIVNGGVNNINFRTTPASGVRTVQLGDLSRANNSLLVVRGDELGSAAANRNDIRFSNATEITAGMIGGGGAIGSTNQSIVPWMRGAFNGEPTTAPGRFVTYGSNGLRTINPTSEMVQANATTRIDQAIAANSGSTTLNMRWNPASSGNTTILNTANTTATVNSLWIGNATNGSAPVTFSLNNGTINVTSGAVHFQHDANNLMTLSAGTLAFGSQEAVITNNAGGWVTTISTTLTGTGGLSLYTLNGGGIILSGANNMSGTVTFGGNGFLGIDQDGRFGNASNSVVHAGGELRIFAPITSSRSLTLLGNVGDNLIANNSSSTITWNGAISGDGRLRLINNAGTVSTAGFVLGGANSYSGGTQIEGINVTASTNSALGTGTVTLLNANGNLANLTLTGAAPTLGGLRGTDGTVTINPTDSSATLTVGSNNENTVYLGSIAQGAGKTGSLAKVGTGTLVLGGVNSYTGATSVTGGTLNMLSRSNSSAFNVSTAGTLLVNTVIDSGAINVTSGGTLGGSGTVLTAVTVQSGGRLSPGNSPGIATYSNLTLESASVFVFELTSNTNLVAARGTAFDGVNILTGGSLSIANGALSNLVFNSTGSTVDWSNTFWDTDRNWLVFSLADANYSGAVPAVSSLSVDSLGATLGSVRSAASFSYSVNGGNVYLNYVAIPEPSTWLLVGLGSFAVLSLRRRRSAASK